MRHPGWSYWLLGAAMWVLGTTLRSSARATMLITVKHPSILWSHPLCTAFDLCLLQSRSFRANHTLGHYWRNHPPAHMKCGNLTFLHSSLSINCLKHACMDNRSCIDRITVLVFLPGRGLRKRSKVSFAYWTNTLLFVVFLFLMIQESPTPSPFKNFTLLGSGGTHL